MRTIYVTHKQKLGNALLVQYSDGSRQTFDLVELGISWFKMTNDAFFKAYGFGFNPHEYPGLYLKCRKIVYPMEYQERRNT